MTGSFSRFVANEARLFRESIRSSLGDRLDRASSGSPPPHGGALRGDTASISVPETTESVRRGRIRADLLVPSVLATRLA
ncbi:hypothetical protein BRC77_06300 [Halobacteriales archaeon QH_8_64_26]|nr:MAG: hypothetical protein BRC77_06300 [Halobacteriales archaeon QH_8_64_26]